MDIKIEMLRCFAEVARHGNLSDAAARLGRSPSAVSMMLKQLQDQLGQPLFASDRKTQLTPLGAFVLDQARAELDHFSHIKQSIAAYVAGEDTVLRIGVVPSAATFLPAVFSRVYDEMPTVRISLRDQDSEQILRGLAEGELDAGIATAPAQMFRLHRLGLLEDRFGVVCTAGHSLASLGRSITTADLHNHRFISNPLVGGLPDHSLRDLGEQAQIHVTNTVSILAMVEAGLGVTILPRTTVPVGQTSLAFLNLAISLPSRKVDAVFPQTSVLSKSQAVFRHALSRELG